MEDNDLRCCPAPRSHFDAPWVANGPINGELFRLHIEKVLAPTLQPGDIVILDNLASHKGKTVRAIRAAGARLFFLPPYSRSQSIEQVFAKLKCQAYLEKGGYGSA